MTTDRAPGATSPANTGNGAPAPASRAANLPAADSSAADSPAPAAPQRSASQKVIYAAIVANLGIATAKFIVAGITGSAAMVAEGIHSAVDTGNEFLLLLGERRSARTADRKHPFGYGKSLYFWALIVALSVFSLGGGLSIYHGVAALQDPPPLEDPLWNYVVLGAAFVFEGYSWNVSRLALNKTRKPGATLWQTMHASKDASVFTVFIEDSAALVGIVIAAAGIALGHYFDNPYIDPVASILIGVLLLVAALVLARETGGLLVGESIDRDELAAVRALFEQESALERVDNMRTMQMGPEEVLLAVAVQFRRSLRMDEVDQAIARLEAAVAAAHPQIRHIYFEASSLRAALR